MAGKRIAVHDQTFHADDCLSVYFLSNTKEFEGADVVRTRDSAELARCDVVCDTGFVYDHEKRRYDHHQPSFSKTFPGSDIPLSSCGVIYLHFGKEIVANILARNNRDVGEHVEYLYKSMYSQFIEEVDAHDNGVEQYSEYTEQVYTFHTGISARIAMLNTDGSFHEAVQLIGGEFEEVLIRMFDSEIPAIACVKEAFDRRMEVDPSGRIIILEEPCSFQNHLKDLEEETNADQVYFAVRPRPDGNWGIATVPTEGFRQRKDLPFGGFRGEALSEACGIPGGVFVHKGRFMGVFETKEGALQFAKLSLTME